MNVDSVDIARDTAVTEWKIPQAKLIENTTGNAAQIPPPAVSFQNEYIEQEYGKYDFSWTT